jgi:hypothetical protein
MKGVLSVVMKIDWWIFPVRFFVNVKTRGDEWDMSYMVNNGLLGGAISPS